jgi:NAD(P) transhydrogenase
MYFDLLIIGAEREGIARAMSEARSGRRVAIIELIDNRILMELMVEAAGRLATEPQVSMDQFRDQVIRVASARKIARQANFVRLGIQRFSGTVRCVSGSTVEIANSGSIQIISGGEIIVACGTRSKECSSFTCDGERIFVAESLLQLREVPRTSLVIGAGTTGLLTAILLARFGIEVTVVDEHVNLLKICTALEGSFEDIQSLPIAFRLGDEAIGSQFGTNRQVEVRLSSGRILSAETMFVCVGRVGNTDTLNLEAVGVGLDERGRIWCDSQGQTWSQGIRAIGTVAGQCAGFTRNPSRRQHRLVTNNP